MGLAPDNKKGEAPKGEWTELIGESYIRTMHGFQVDSTAEQDERFMAIFNDKKNVGHFNLLFHNCADFSRMVLDIYMPHAVHRNFIADVGLMTPKQVARSLVAYSQKDPDVNMSAFVIPQVPGTIPRSHAVDGVAESLVKSKKYLIPMTILAPAGDGGRGGGVPGGRAVEAAEGDAGFQYRGRGDDGAGGADAGRTWAAGSCRRRRLLRRRRIRRGSPR